MSSLDELITETDRFAVQLTLAHEDLLTHARKGDAEALKTWREVRLEGLRESSRTVARHRRGRASSLGTVFQRYADLAAGVIDDVRAADPVGVARRETALIAEWTATRQAADLVVRTARRWKVARSFAIWLLATATSVGMAIWTANYQLRLRVEESVESQKKRDAEARVSLELQRGMPCTADDWDQAGTLDRSKASCLAWSMQAWRAAPAYELTASLTVLDGEIVRTRTRWIDAKGTAAREFGGPEGPAPELSTWVCEVPKDAEIRLVVWWRHPTHRAPLTAYAYVKETGQSPC